MTAYDLTTLARKVATAASGGTSITIPRMSGREFRVFLSTLRSLAPCAA